MKKPVCFLVYFLLLSLFIHQRGCAADLSSDLTLLNGRLGTLKLKLAELSTALQKLKDSLKPKISSGSGATSLIPPIVPISTPVSASEYTLEEFQKLFASAIPIPTLDTPPALSETSIDKYTDEEIKEAIDNLINGRNFFIKAKNQNQVTHMEVNRQDEYHTCGYHALCNAIHFFNYFRNNTSSYYFPNPDDSDFFKKKFRLWRPLVLQKTTEMAKINNFNVKKDIYTEETGDLDDVIFDIILDGDSDIKELWESGALIFYPYSRPSLSILSLDVEKHAPHYELCIKKFRDNDSGILIWILGQNKHYYTLCAVKNNKKYHFLTCDSMNTSNLTQTEIETLGNLNTFCRLKQSFQQFYANKILKEIELNNISIVQLLRELQDHPELIAYLSAIDAKIEQNSAASDRDSNFQL